jgi:hypothetical protein
VSALRADVWADLIAWCATTGPVFVLHHLMLRRHVTKVTRKQTAILTKPPDEGTS